MDVPMRNANLLLIVTGILSLISCKRENDVAPATRNGRIVATQPSPSPAAPTTQPAAQPDAANDFEVPLLQFIAASRRVVAAARAGRVVVEPTPDGFDALTDLMRENDALKTSVAAAGMSSELWKATGARAWAAWSIAQGDYNTEMPLRQNQKRLADVRARLLAAEGVVKGGQRVLSPQERALRVAGAKDAAVNARDRAEMWAQRAADLRERLGGADADRGAIPGQPPGDLGLRNEALADLRAARSTLLQELAAAERNERLAREDGTRFEEAAQHPEQASNDTEKSDLLREARETIKNAATEIARLQEEATVLQARLSEDSRVNAAARRKVPESDVLLLRKHLVDFDDAWGMTVEGQVR
jgi:hypothetical protein